MLMNIFSLVLVATATITTVQCFQVPTDPKEITDMIMKGMDEFKETGIKPQYFEDLLDAYHFNRQILRRGKPLIPPKASFECTACFAIIDAALTKIAEGASRDEIIEYMTLVCTTFTTELPDVCSGLMEVNIDVALYIFNAKPGITKEQICGIVYQSGNCSTVEEEVWEINIAPGTTPPRPDPSADPPLKIIQLSDIHYDPYYYAGGSVDCGRPTCCAAPPDGEEVPIEDQAGIWGEWPCDTPLNVIENLCLSSLQQHPDVDYVYFTGDMISHRVWNTSIEENDRDLRQVYNLMATIYEDTPVFPILGNHEPHPVNVFSPENLPDAPLPTSWLFNQIAEEWMVWLPASTQETLRRGGYYTVLVRPGFRIIGLNNNVCNTFNWWLMYSTVDQYGQLQWLADTLLEAETNGELVHILAHFPPGSSGCYVTWGTQYRRIVERFSNTIVAQFNGDTHNDELRIFYSSSEPEKVINVAWNGGSGTTFTDLNPNYKVYQVDPVSYEVLDFASWYFDVEQANTAGVPQWAPMYTSFRESFGLATLGLDDMAQLPLILLNEPGMYETYYRHKCRDAAPSMDSVCDDVCKLHDICGIVTSEYGDNTQCDAISRKVQQ